MLDLQFPDYFFQGQKIINSEPGMGSVWISGWNFAQNQSKLRENKIVAIVSAVDLGIKFSQKMKVLQLNMDDRVDCEVRFTFIPVYRFIQENRRVGNVLVHCAAGISRSATLLIAYMMNRYSSSFQVCLRRMVKIRPCVQPNKGFAKQLRSFQEDLRVKDSDGNLPVQLSFFQ